jgi:hypothetical protein
LLDREHDRTAIPQRELQLQLGGIRADDLQSQLLLLNQRQRSPRSMPAATLAAFDDGVETARLGTSCPFQNRSDMNTTHFSDVRPRVALPAKNKRLPADVFEGFGWELSRVDLFHARIMAKPI